MYWFLFEATGRVRHLNSRKNFMVSVFKYTNLYLIMPDCRLYHSLLSMVTLIQNIILLHISAAEQIVLPPLHFFLTALLKLSRLVVKIHSSRTGLEPTTSMAPTRLAMQGGHAIHYTISPSPKRTA